MADRKPFDLGLSIPARLLISEDPHATHDLVGFYRVGDGSGALWCHTLLNGQCYEESVQYLDTGIPVILLALRDMDGRWVRESLWSEMAPEMIALLAKAS